MASQVEIVNRALIKIGGNRITSMGDDSKSAKVMSALWDTVRKSEITKRYWNFALARAQLAKLSTAPSWNFQNQFQLPVDFLKIVQVNDMYIVPSMTDYVNGDNSPYAIAGQTIETDFEDPLKIRYVKDIADPGLFDHLFVEVLASKLAYEACYEITQSRQGCDQALNDYNIAIKEAYKSNAISRPPQSIPDDSWILSRL